MTRLLQDLRFATRLLRGQPVFTAATVATLALGIGVNSAIFSVVDAVLLRPWPYEKPGELIALRGSFETQRSTWVAYRELLAWQERSRAFEAVAGHRQVRNRMEIDGRPVGAIGVQASSNLFALLGVEPLLGRTFTAAEDRPGAPGVVVLSHAFWQRSFGGRDSVLGEVLRIEGEPFEIIGVMPPGVLYPGDFRDTAMWTPLGQLSADWGWTYETHAGLSVTGRLADGVDLAAAREDLDRIAAELAAERPDTHQGRGIFAQPVLDRSFGRLRPRVWALTAAALLVLAIACVNVANLLLVHGAGRGHELAIRRSLGASRGTLARQLLVESVTLALVGATAGLAVAWWTLRGLEEVAGIDSMPAFRDLAIDPRILAFTLLAAGVTGLVFGVAPALTSARGAGSRGLEGEVRGTPGRRRSRLRSTLVVAEIALALVLAIGAVLAVRSFDRILSDSPGFDPGGLFTFAFSLPDEGYSPEQQAAVFDRLLTGLEALPEIERATTTIPIAAYWSTSFEIAGRPPEDDRLSAAIFKVSPGFFETLGVTRLRGRTFTSADRAAAAPVLVVDQLFAETFWPDGTDAIGQRVRLATDPADGPGREIVGVVERTGYEGPHRPPKPTVYQPIPQAQEGWGWAVMRTMGDPARLAVRIRREVEAIDPQLMVDELWTMDERLAARRSSERLAAALLSSFAAIALALAAVGVYGVIAGAVAARGREMGIRMALGADRRQILWMVLARGLRLSAAGVAAGWVLAVIGVRALASQLYGVAPYDPVTWIGLAVAVVIGSLLASAVPAWRASRLQPAAVVRGE